jgi:hypothetical protein
MDRVAELQRWQDHGAVWRVIARGAGSVTISLVQCHGGEEVSRFTSSDPELVAYRGGRLSSAD